MDCTFTTVGDGYELTFERRLGHSTEKVWRVLTERDLLKQWFPADVIGDWKVGEDLQFAFPPGEHEGLPEEVMRGEVVAVEPLKHLEFSWGKFRYRCELSPDGDGCLLRFTESYSDRSQIASSATGWEMCIENLEAVLQGDDAADFVKEIWQAKFEKYVGKFEPEMGPQQGAPEDR